MEDFLDSLVSYNSSTNGRDKIIRLFQYSSRFLWWAAEKCKYNKDVVNKLKNLEYALSSGRKLLRFGRSLDTLYGALKTIHLPNLVLRVTLTMAKINQGLFLLMDHVLWTGKVGLAEVNNAKWSKRSNKFWLFSILLLLSRDIYELWQIISLEMRLRSSCAMLSNPALHFTMGSRFTPSTCAPLREEVFSSLLAPISRWVFEHKDVVLDTVRNSCDVILPLNGLGYTNFSPGLIGICGVVSSVIGILTILDPMCRLQP